MKPIVCGPCEPVADGLVGGADVGGAVVGGAVVGGTVVGVTPLLQVVPLSVKLAGTGLLLGGGLLLRPVIARELCANDAASTVLR